MSPRKQHYTIKRAGQNTTMTSGQIRVLRELNEARLAGNAWSTAPVEKRIAARLMRLGMIFRSVDPHGHAPTAYKILPPGIKALEIFGPRYQKDDICPSCKQERRFIRRSGVLSNYCRECEHQQWRAQSYRRLTEHTDQPCVDCGVNPRAVTAGGWQYPRCIDCQRAHSREHRRKRDERIRARIAAGEIIKCRCGNAPIHVTESRVEQYCLDCVNRYARQGRRKKRLLKQRGSEAAD